jgi:hypothetical protein
MKYRRMTFNKWAETFCPVKNKLAKNAAGGGMMFETYGEEVDHVLSYANGKACPGSERMVWTLVEGDSGRLVIVEGYHYVNRVGYFITSRPFLDDYQYGVSY